MMMIKGLILEKQISLIIRIIFNKYLLFTEDFSIHVHASVGLD